MRQELKNKYYKLLSYPNNIAKINEIFTKIDNLILTSDGLYNNQELLNFIEPLKDIESLIYNALKLDIEKGVFR